MSMQVSDFQAALNVVYGHHVLDEPSSLLKRLNQGGKRILLVSDHMVSKLPFFRKLHQALLEDGFTCACDVELHGEPELHDVERVRQRSLKEKSDIVIGIGGGSVLDLSKLGAVLRTSDEPVDDFALGMKPLPARDQSLVLIPTTAGTGSEATRVGIYANAEGKKTWMYGDVLRADLAVLDSSLTTSLPEKITIESGLDALIHAVEASCNVNAHAFTIGYTLQAMRLIRRSLMLCVREPGNEKARLEMLIASCLAGMAIDQGGTALGHAFGHALGSLAKVSHGRSVAIGFLASLQWMREQDPEAFLDPAEGFGIFREGRSPLDVSEDFHEAFESFVRGTGIVLDLSDVGLSETDVERLSEEVMNEENQAMCRSTRGEFNKSVARQLSQQVLNL